MSLGGRGDGRGDCGRTRGLLDRAIRGEITPDDRDHASTCASCGPVVQRTARFDAELSRAARSLITEELPRNILDPSLDGRAGVPRVVGRQSVTGLSTAVAVIAVLLVAGAVAIGPLGPATSPTPSVVVKPTKSPGPLFKTTSEIIAHVVDLEYSCNDGFALPTSGPSAGLASQESAVCTAPDGLDVATAAIVIGESAEAKVVTVWLKADLLGEDSPSSRDAVARQLSKLADIAIKGEYESIGAMEVILGRLTRLQPGEVTRTEVGSARFELAHLDRETFSVRIDTIVSASPEP